MDTLEGRVRTRTVLDCDLEKVSVVQPAPLSEFIWRV